MVNRCVGEPTNARNAVTVTTVTAVLQGLGGGSSLGRKRTWGQWQGRGTEVEGYLRGAKAKANDKLSVYKVGHNLYLIRPPTKPRHLSTRR